MSKIDEQEYIFFETEMLHNNEHYMNMFISLTVRNNNRIRIKVRVKHNVMGIQKRCGLGCQ
jgi:hypothetical protein